MLFLAGGYAVRNLDLANRVNSRYVDDMYSALHSVPWWLRRRWQKGVRPK
jgi:hypothetical protein